MACSSVECTNHEAAMPPTYVALKWWGASLSQFLWHWGTMSLSDYLPCLQTQSPLDGILFHCRVAPALNLVVPIYTPGWREALCLAQEPNAMTPSTAPTLTSWYRSTCNKLTIRPPCLHIYVQCTNTIIMLIFFVFNPRWTPWSWSATETCWSSWIVYPALSALQRNWQKVLQQVMGYPQKSEEYNKYTVTYFLMQLNAI